MYFTQWIISTLAIIIGAYLLPGVSVTFIGALVTAVVLGIINLFIKPIITILTLPITVVTLGIFYLVINATMIMLAGVIVPDFTVDSFWYALLFSIIVSLVNAILTPKKRHYE